MDDRDKVLFISSQNVLKSEANHKTRRKSIFEIGANIKAKTNCFLLDELEYLEKKRVFQLAKIVEELKIPVIDLALNIDF
nr:hypothetical protein [Listeria monocytogenes]